MILHGVPLIIIRLQGLFLTSMEQRLEIPFKNFPGKNVLAWQQRRGAITCS